MQEKNKGSKVAIIAVVLVAIVGLGAWALMSNDDKQANKETSSMGQSTAEESTANTIVDVAMSDPQFSTLVTAIKAAGLVETLSGEGPFTVFVPTNDAFAKLPEGTLDSLLNNPEELKKVLTYHVVSGDVKAADVVKLSSAKTVQGQDVRITVDGNTVKVNDSVVTKTDISTKNGTIHVIDSVLLPQ